jgi:hypothetical protein
LDGRLYSRPLDVHRISEYPEVKKVINFLLSELNISGLIKNSPRAKILKHLKVVVLDLYIAYLSDPLIYVAYSRSKDKYLKENQRLRKLHLGYGPMIRVVDGLETLGYLENHKGFQDRLRDYGRQARMRATSKLVDLIQSSEVSPVMVGRLDDEVIVLRGANREILPYEDTDETCRMREWLLSFNAFLGEFKLELSLPLEQVRPILLERKANALDYSRNRLYRRFKYDFSSGGRFYNGWWQEIPKEFRPYITINGEPTSELDYSGQHLLLLYGLKEDEFYWLKGEGDPYAAEGLGETGRDLMKQVVLICVNAETRLKAIRAIRKEIVKNYPNFSRTNEFINPLIDETLDRHPLLADCFFSTRWKELQYHDSKVAEYVLKDMKARGQPVLPVHDSFVVQDQYIEHLYVSMEEAYRMLGIDSIPVVKLKKGANSDSNQPSFKKLENRMEERRAQTEKELEGLKKLEDLFD